MPKKKKRKINLTMPLIIIVATCAFIAMFYYLQTPPAPPDDSQLYYRQAASNIMAQVDSVLKANKVSVTQASTAHKTQRYKSATVVWTERSQFLTLDNLTSIEELVAQLDAQLKQQNGSLMPLEQDNRNGQAVERLDIVVPVKENIADKPVTLIIDRLYFIPAAPPPVVSRSGRLAIVIDDCGYDMDSLNKMTALSQKISFAVFPNRELSAAALKRIKDRNKEALLHLPMEPINRSQQSEKVTILVDMSDDTIKKITSDALAQLPGVAGVNNHQGSRATADERVMRAVLSVVKEQGLFFLDSRTHHTTFAHQTAARMGIKSGTSLAFIDSEANVASIKNSIRQAGERALKEGSYIAIGHARPQTATALSEMVGELEKMGVELVFVSELLK